MNARPGMPYALCKLKAILYGRFNPKIVICLRVAFLHFHKSSIVYTLRVGSAVKTFKRAARFTCILHFGL